jgi:hypothetical protein
MTGSPASPDATGGPALDRRWFEEALRSQGFVVEPPQVDDEPVDVLTERDHAASADDDPTPAQAGPANAGPAPPSERPPVPSALLARIATRGPGATSAAGEPTVATPWGDALVATVAPWSSPAAPDAPAAADDEDVTAGPADEAAAADHADVKDVAVPTDPAAEASADPARRAEPEPTKPIAATATQALDSPYAEAAVAQPASPVASGAPAVGPEASEGELWALVGGVTPAAAQAAGGGAVRLVLTVLTALVILVIVVGSLVLATQLA